MDIGLLLATKQYVKRTVNYAFVLEFIFIWRWGSVVSTVTKLQVGQPSNCSMINSKDKICIFYKVLTTK
jgi:hypothetical protein